jgi:2,3-dihydroxyphenylpropionate 1,2-dioxygenase
MAEIVGCIAMSHSPLWSYQDNVQQVPADLLDRPGADFAAEVDKIAELVTHLSPDAVVLVGPDHARGMFYDLMPPFTIGTGTVEAMGDYGTPSGPLVTDTELAMALFQGISDRGFDPAISLDLKVDHGITQCYEKLFPSLNTPLVPVVVNCGCPPLPSFRRCWDFGRALGEALNAAPGGRVLVVGSGGMSHWPNSLNALDPDVSEEWRDFLVHGRDRVREVESDRQAKSLAFVADPAAGRINATWDRVMLGNIAEEPAALSRLDNSTVEFDAGPGALELRTWGLAAGAWGAALPWTAYEPVPGWITGMGLATNLVPASSTSPTLTASENGSPA